MAESRRAIAALTDRGEDRLDRALERMVDDLTRRAGTHARVVVEPGLEVDSTTREALLRIVHEAVTNASRHGHAEHVSVRVSNGDGVRVSVTDDGGGFDAAALQRGAAFGLMTMRERAEALGGELHVSSAPGETRIEAVLP